MLCLGTVLVASVVATSSDLLWGPYRPNLYFGVRPQHPLSLLSGLMWYGSDHFASVQNLRHDENMIDSIYRSGWSHYDPRTGGRQEIFDQGQHVNITIDFVKSIDGWEARISGQQPEEQSQTLVWYSSLEGQGNLELSSELSEHGLVGDAVLLGKSPELGEFKLTVTEGTGARPKSNHIVSHDHPALLPHYTCLNVPDNESWRAKEIFLTLAQDQITQLTKKYSDNTEALEGVPVWAAMALNDDKSLGGNFHFIQQSFTGPFEFSVRYSKLSGKDDEASLPDFDTRIKQVLDNQETKFNAAFELQPPFNLPEYSDFARKIISDLAGGLGYFWGDMLVSDGEDGIVDTEPPHELLTLTPSRPFFPRGFYWDEGFHLLSLLEYDTDLALDITSSWFRAMDADGWIAREQILGPEGRSRVPLEFQVQKPTYANPPTPVMFLAHLGTKDKDPGVVDHLRSLYPQLERHFAWFRRTQRGEVSSYDRDFPSREAYRWRGRTPSHVLTSGMDDYPRARDPSDGELHVDLLSWVGAMADALERIAKTLDLLDDAQKYADIRQDVVSNLIAAHWDSRSKSFCDISVDEFEEDVYECHVGYVTILPFLLKLIDENATVQLSETLKQLGDPQQLWSQAGIRSLSRQDAQFGTDENYWRGSVWIQMNYLTLDALQFYANSRASKEIRQAASELYAKLRVAVVSNVYENWQQSGYVWERYDGISGAPIGAKQFTGWTALIANIMAMPETTEKVIGSHDEL